MRHMSPAMAFALLALNAACPTYFPFAPTPAQAEPAAENAAEKEAFEAAKALGTTEAWDAFLKAYPTGFRADLAKAYQKKIAAPTTAPQPSPTPTAKAATDQLPPAQELLCGEAKSLKSLRSNEPVTIRFVNESGAVRVIQWINFDGALKEYAELQPGQEFEQKTYITHPWIAAYQEGSCAQLFMPLKGTTVARLVPDTARQAVPAKPKPRVEEEDHGGSPEQTCRSIGQTYNGLECVPKAKANPKPSQATIERRAAKACVDMGMIYLNGKCAPKTKKERDTGKANKNLPCPKGQYRNPYGQCQPNETGG